MGFFAGIPLWVLLLCVGQVNAYFAELVVSADNQYMYHEHYGFLGFRSLADNNQLMSLNSRNMITSGINFDKVCSYWNNFHYKTFNDRVFYFPGSCTYVFASHCKKNYEDFVIQIRHMTDENNSVLYTNVTLKIDEVLIQLNNDIVLVQGEVVDPPYSLSTIIILRTSLYTQVSSSIGLLFTKYQDGSFELQLDGKYTNQTCGLCGNLMGIGVFHMFDIPYTETEFGNLQKADGPNENCPNAEPANWSDCSKENEMICEMALKSSHFESCLPMIAAESYIEACRQDLCQCRAADKTSCVCSTVAQYSHQCILHRGQPGNWRRSDFCYRSCPSNMLYRECGSPCMKSCSDPERHLVCDEHCVEGCYCPQGYIYDDVGSNECIRLEECPCSYNGNIYDPGESYSTSCRTCTCSSGKWNCTAIPCSATCSIEGGSHITTFDQLRYNMHGDCNYVISKDCNRGLFTIMGELRHCGLRLTEACLKGVTIFLNNASTKLEVKLPSQIYVNGMKTRLPIYSVSEKYIMFQPSPFYIVVKSTSIGLLVVVQIVPIMQLYVVLDPAFKTNTCGLCGNFNSIQNDDFRSISGIIEGTASAFVNTWKLTSDCPNIRDTIDDPCTLSVESAEYAKHWCGQLVDPTGVFSNCHHLVDPDIYYKNCLMDTCSCEKTENCMCTALFSYYKICASRGITITDWHIKACDKYSTACPETQIYSYTISSCLPTCRSLSEPDILCRVLFDPLIGCTCKKGFYLNENGRCIHASACPCYFGGNEILPDQSITDNGILCTCKKGKLTCLTPNVAECKPPMIMAMCHTRGSTGTECAKSCQTLEMQCYSTRCVPGCICPPGLLSDGNGGCIEAESCPCVHNGVMYNPGEKIQVRCNTCVCETRRWECTNNSCLATCTIYGDGHYITFDGKRYIFNGECQYTLSQDHCSVNDNGTFRIITENVPCGTTGMTCSKSIKVFLESYEFILVDDHLNVVQRGSDLRVPYRVRLMGIYLVIETKSGLLLLWDKKTSIFIKVTSDFKGKLCGLCGNYDGNAINDFTTRNNAIVGNIEEFGNSWKLSSTCPDAKVNRDPCSLNPYRVSWAQKQCSVLGSEVFSACHPYVDPFKYYEACVTDTCACNTGGDCECLCTAISAYAQICGEFGICISWRTPRLCPLFCDYYNEDKGCKWHYKPCGAPCMKTCRNSKGTCDYLIRGLEGCYPNCPPETPYFDEDEMQCVAVCGCYDEERKHYKLGADVPSGKNCYVCTCTMDGIVCVFDVYACTCTYEGHMYKYNEIVYNITSPEGCGFGICKENGTIFREIYPCPTTTQATHTTELSTKTTTFTTTHSTAKTILTTTRKPTTTIKTSPTTQCQRICTWTEFYSLHEVTLGPNGGDFENLYRFKVAGIKVCAKPEQIECRATEANARLQKTTCTVDDGFICENKHQMLNFLTCYDYEIRYKCCETYCRSTSIKTTSPKTTRPTTISARTTTPRSTSPKLRSSTFTTVSTTICHCKVNGSLFQPGDTISSMPDSYGCIISQICIQNCEVKTFRSCPTSSSGATTFRTTTKTSPPSSTALTKTTPKTSPRTRTTTKITRPSTTASTKSTLLTTVTTPKTSPRTRTTTKITRPSTTASTKSTLLTKVTTPKTSPRTTTPKKTTLLSTTVSKKTTPKTSTKTATTRKSSTTASTKSTPLTTALRSTSTPKSTLPSTTALTKTTLMTKVTTPKTSPRTTTPTKTTLPSTTALTKTTQFTTVTATKTSLRSTRTTTTSTLPSTTASKTTTPKTSTKTATTTKSTPTVTTPKTSPRTTTPTKTTLPSTTALTKTTQFTTVTAPKTSLRSTRTTSTLPSTTASKTTTPKTSTKTATTTKSTPPVTTVKSSTTVITKTTELTSTLSGCSGRKINETWFIDNCTYATCLGNNVIVIKNVTCPPITTTSCATGVKPTVIKSDDGCCTQNVCECICSGRGNGNFLTFDGTSYNYQDTCTDVLVQEINQTHGDFRVLLDKSNCSTTFSGSCDLTLLVQYKGYDVRLTKKGGVIMAFLNSVNVYPVYTNDDIIITGSSEQMVVLIPTIDTYIILSNTFFEISLPSTLFHNNTEGQCGTCSNDRTDDCRLPGGTIIPDCSLMASYWKNDSLSKPDCAFVTKTPYTKSIGAVPTSCPSSSICSIISSNVFKECQNTVPPESYFKQCLASNCDETTFCDSVAFYAAKCTLYGICTDWRNNTECSYECPHPKVYKPCSNIQQPTCSSSIFPNIPTFIGDVCVCPNDTIRYSASQDICIPNCDVCVVNNTIYKAGTTLPPSYDNPCYECNCTSQKDPITKQNIVKCGYKTCEGQCQPGFQHKAENGSCCGCVQDACIIQLPNGTQIILQVNNTWYPPDNKCLFYDCQKVNGQFITEKHNIICSENSQSDCPQGYEYRKIEGQCCGVCFRLNCTFQLPNNTTKTLQPGECWSPPNDNCTKYNCTNDAMIITERITCQPFDPLTCEKGLVTTDKDGCCKLCTAKQEYPCNIHTNVTTLYLDGCKSLIPVNATYCEGTCPSKSMYSFKNNKMEGECTCCVPTKIRETNIPLECTNGTSFNYNYSLIEACSCSPPICEDFGNKTIS